MGYCIGGKLAFATAGAHPARVAAAAVIHAGGIAGDAPDSPHKLAPAIEGRLYFGIADNDPSCTPEQQGVLAAALAAAHVRSTIEHVAGKQHGYAVPDFPTYDANAAETHFERIRDLFAASL
jgi:carboxymethylenebutenolidase